MVSFRVLDQTEDHDCIVGCGFQALADEGAAGIRALAGHGCQFGEPFVEQPLPRVRRFSARSASFGNFSGFWLLGFIHPVIRGVNPPLKLRVSASRTVGLILDRLLMVATHAP